MGTEFWRRPDTHGKTFRLVKRVRDQIVANPAARIAIIASRDTVAALRPEFTAAELAQITFVDPDRFPGAGGPPIVATWFEEEAP